MAFRDGAKRDLLLVRADAGRGIGLGHVARCGSIAREVVGMGGEVLFAVSNAESAAAVRVLGFDACLVGGGFEKFDDADASPLRRLVAEVGACSVLVDSYAATPGFLSTAHSSLSAMGVSLAYIDDIYRYDSGFLGQPQAYDVDLVINYSFGADSEAYRVRYADRSTRLLVGPGFAPVREEFRGAGRPVGEIVERILVTSGSTNPGRALERIVNACHMAAPDAELDVVVGPAAVFDEDELGGGRSRVRLHKAPSSLDGLMAAADMAVSGAGSTLYELACAGVPAVAVALVENQLVNLRGWAGLFPETAVGSLDWSEWELYVAVKRLAESRERRAAHSSQMRSVADGLGARRIAAQLLESGVVSGLNERSSSV